MSELLSLSYALRSLGTAQKRDKAQLMNGVYNLLEKPETLVLLARSTESLTLQNFLDQMIDIMFQEISGYKPNPRERSLDLSPPISKHMALINLSFQLSQLFHVNINVCDDRIIQVLGSSDSQKSLVRDLSILMGKSLNSTLFNSVRIMELCQCLFKLIGSSQISEIALSSILKGYMLRTSTTIEEIASITLRILHDPAQMSDALRVWIWGTLNFPHNFSLFRLVPKIKMNVLQHAFDRPARSILHSQTELTDCTFVKSLSLSRSQLADLANLNRITFYQLVLPDLNLDNDVSYPQTLLIYANLLLIDMITSTEDATTGAMEIAQNLFSSCWKAIIRDSYRSDFSSKLNLHALLAQLSKIFQLAALASVFLIRNKISFPEIGSVKLGIYEEHLELCLTLVRCLDTSFAPFSWVIIAHVFQILTILKLSGRSSEDLVPFLQFFSDVFNEQNSLLELELMLNAFLSLLNCLELTYLGQLAFGNLVQQILAKLTKTFDYSSAKRATNVKFLEQKISQSNVEYLLIQSLIRISRFSVPDSDSYERMLIYLKGKLECNMFSSYHSDLLVNLVIIAKKYPKLDKAILHKANLIQSKALDLVLCSLFPSQIEEEVDSDASIFTQKNLLKCLLTLLDKHRLFSEDCPLYSGYVSPSAIRSAQVSLVESLGSLASITSLDGELLSLATECFVRIRTDPSSETAIQYSNEAFKIVQSIMTGLYNFEKSANFDHQRTKRIRLEASAINQFDLERTTSLLSGLQGESDILDDLNKDFKIFLKNIRPPFEEEASKQHITHVPDFEDFENAESKLTTDSFSAGNGIIKIFDEDARWRSHLIKVCRFLSAFLKFAFRKKHMKTISRFVQHLSTLELTSLHTVLIFEQLVNCLCDVVLEDSKAQSVTPLLLIQTLCPASELLNNRLVENFRKGQFDSVLQMVKLFNKMCLLFLVSVSQPGVLSDQSREPINELLSFFDNVVSRTFVSLKQFIFAVGDPIITEFHATCFVNLYQTELTIMQAQSILSDSTTITSSGCDDLLLSMVLNVRTSVPAQEIILNALFFRNQFCQYWNVAFLKTRIHSLIELLRLKAQLIPCSDSRFLGYLLDCILGIPSQLYDAVFLKSFASVIFNWTESWPPGFSPDLETVFKQKLSKDFSSRQIFVTFKQIFFYPHLKNFSSQFYEIESLKRFITEPELSPWLVEISLQDNNNNRSNEPVDTIIKGILLAIAESRKTTIIDLSGYNIEEIRRSISFPTIFSFYLQNCSLKKANFANPLIQLLDFTLSKTSSIQTCDDKIVNKKAVLKSWFKKQAQKGPAIVHELLQLSNEIFMFPSLKILANFEKERHFHLAGTIWLMYVNFLTNTLSDACTTQMSTFLRDFLLKNYFDLLWTTFEAGYDQCLNLFLKQFPKLFPPASLERSNAVDALFNLGLEMMTRHHFVQNSPCYDQLKIFFKILLSKTGHFYLPSEMAIHRRFPLCTEEQQLAFLEEIEDGAAEAPFSIQLQRLHESLSFQPIMKLNRAWALYNLSSFWSIKTVEDLIDFTVPATDFVDRANDFTLSCVDEQRLNSVILAISTGSDFESRKAALFCQELFLSEAPLPPLKEIKMLPSCEFLLDKVKDICLLANKPSQADTSVTAMKIIRAINDKGFFFKSASESKFNEFEHRAIILQQFSLFDQQENIFQSRCVKLAKNASVTLEDMKKLLRLCKKEPDLATKICEWLIKNKLSTETAFCYFSEIFEQSKEFSRSFVPWMLVDFLKGFELYSTGKESIISRLQESFSEVEYWFLNADLEQSQIWIETMLSLHLEAEFYRLNKDQLFSEFTFPIDLNTILRKSLVIPQFSFEFCAQLFERAWLMYQPLSEEYLHHFVSLEMWLEILFKQKNISGIKTVQLLIAKMGGSWTEEYENLKNKSELSLEKLQSHQSGALEKLSSWDEFCSVATEMAQNSSLTNLSSHFHAFEKTLTEENEVLSKLICIEKLLSPKNEFSLVYKVLDSFNSVASSATFFAMGSAINLEVQKETPEVETVGAFVNLRLQELGVCDKYEVFKSNTMSHNLQARYLEAKRMFDMGNVKLACGILSTAIEQANFVSADLRLLRTLESLSIVYADWLWTSRSEDLPTIINDVLEPVLNKLVDFQLQSLELVKSISTSYDCMARFCDHQYTDLTEYFQSASFTQRRDLLSRAQLDSECLAEIGDKSKYLAMLKKFTKMEEEDFKKAIEKRFYFLRKAFQAYLQCLTCSDAYEIHMYRVVYLWLFSQQEMGNEYNLLATEMTNQMSKYFPDGSKTAKFLDLFPQLIVRISAEPPACERKLQKYINDLVLNILVNHVDECIFPLLAQVNANYDQETEKNSRLNAPMDTQEQLRRTKAAQGIFDKLKTQSKIKDPRLHEKLLSLNMYALALIEVANINDNYLSNNTYPLPAKWALSKLSHNDKLAQISLPTLTQTRSNEPVKIIRYEHEFSLVSGVNKPKVFKILCTDGRTRRQLVKGRDDPRQDAVMQQIFRATNCILGKGRKRPSSQAMQMRTYKVVSLSKQCGAIEWCEGTTPVNPWLVMGHQRYRPDDLKTNQAMASLFQVAKEGKPEKLLAKFKEIWHKIGPVFGFFFLERFPNPADWHRAKNIYATSLAVSSIVGYIVGLGDRHTNNILVDLSCGELIHIDLGIAFDQGKCLPTPELVPFRLTRDFEQALGPKGVEISLHPIAEQVLQTLQSSGEVIVTLLQVLLHDPLYAWCLTPSRLLDLERRRIEKLSSDPSLSMSLYSFSSFIGISCPSNESSNSTNQLARKVIMTVRERLQPPAPGKIGVSAQIEQLLVQARSYENLSRMYYGWQSYM